MDIAVLSDIHGNYIALERCLDYAFSRGISTFLFLGDYIGELAYPERTMKMIYDLNDSYHCYFIKGNKEDYWLEYRSGGETGWKDKNSASGALLYAYNLLTARDLDFFAQLRPVREITIGKMPEITICHGSPDKVNDKMLPDDDKTIEIMRNVKTSIILCGHTHIQRKIIYNDKCVLNPGAVGMPLFSNGKTQFLIMHGNNGIWSEEFISLVYDVEKVIREMHEVSLYEHAPFWSLITENTLYNGNTSHGKILLRAMELCRVETGECMWPDIPEKFWAQAVNEIIGAIEGIFYLYGRGSMKPFINNFDDIMEFLDSQAEGVSWNDFYELRNRPANFILQNEVPDENLVEFFGKGIPITSSIEFGCGEGRNAIFMAKQGVSVTALDASETAIENAKRIAGQKGVNVNFSCQNIFTGNINGKYDFVYDSGMFHHLAPHRRITYIELLKKILNPGGYFGLVCFAWGENCADEIDDWEFYQQRKRVGVAFSKERLIQLFAPHFEMIEIRKYRNGIPGTIQGLDFMWTCLFRKSSAV